MTTHQAIKKTYNVCVAPDRSGEPGEYLWFNEDDCILLDNNDVEKARELAESINTLREAVVGYQQALNCIGRRLLKSEE